MIGMPKKKSQAELELERVERFLKLEEKVYNKALHEARDYKGRLYVDVPPGLKKTKAVEIEKVEEGETITGGAQLGYKKTEAGFKVGSGMDEEGREYIYKTEMGAKRKALDIIKTYKERRLSWAGSALHRKRTDIIADKIEADQREVDKAKTPVIGIGDNKEDPERQRPKGWRGYRKMGDKSVMSDARDEDEDRYIPKDGEKEIATQKWFERFSKITKPRKKVFKGLDLEGIKKSHLKQIKAQLKKEEIDYAEEKVDITKPKDAPNYYLCDKCGYKHYEGSDKYKTHLQHGKKKKKVKIPETKGGGPVLVKRKGYKPFYRAKPGEGKKKKNK